MATDFNELNRKARDRGEADFHRNVRLDNNPWPLQGATDEGASWREGWMFARDTHREEVFEKAVIARLALTTALDFQYWAKAVPPALAEGRKVLRLLPHHQKEHDAN